MSRRRVPVEELEPFARDIVGAYGATDEAAEQVAESLVEADLRGHRSHGTIRLPMLYRRMLDEGVIDPAATPEVLDGAGAGATATVDGNHAFGQVVGRHAVDAATERAAEHGVAAVGVRNGAHLGRIGEWAERAAGDGFLFAAWVNTGGLAPLVGLSGSADRRIATNPIAFGTPSFGALEFPIVLDMATSQVAHGKISKRAVEGEPLPEGWAIDAAGEYVTDASRFEEGEGAILPLGGTTSGYKGFGLAVMAELFAGMLGDAFVAGQDPEGIVNNAAAFVAVDPDGFASQEANRARVEALAENVASADYPDEVLPGDAARGDRALLPGESEHRTRAERAAEGVPLAAETVALFVDLAEELGVEEVPPSFR
ncbi:MAG: Ldh family oxidoreductase [Haloarculaceae archaeon]